MTGSTVMTVTPSKPLLRRRSSAPLWIAVGVLVLFVLAAAIGPLLLGYDGTKVDNGARLLPPGSVLSNGQIAWLGTDQVGRDVAAQIMQGARVSLIVGVATLVLAGLLGTLIGVVSGYYGGAIDSVFMRIADIQLAFPSILLAILISAILGPSIVNVIIVLAISRWVTFARVARSATLAVKDREFVQAGRLLGAPDLSLLVRYVLPSALSSLVVVATVEFGLVIIAEASLSFLGLGTTDAMPSWGLIIANGRDYIPNAWWISTFPGIALAIVMVAIGVLGDRLRDRLDPALA
ncbi:ABC transporter permease [Agromyces aerolatus]|uniref:ABC transporter permease n=1 Tax=Agromyces sp. LY-1074 TaxID=3074080 RepID=UPI00285A3F38|nr:MULTISPECIES: ABC transporter permease [unclassified Agromyces]MDR5701204.1 ABC transporter permease [Agromyces sp. LY-1074]MDR5706920.1 ABC transporter permease [Agromyces sp. LY-1358]